MFLKIGFCGDPATPGFWPSKNEPVTPALSVAKPQKAMQRGGDSRGPEERRHKFSN